MRVVHEENWELLRGACVALGMFDGMHLGHRAVIGQAARLAGEEGRPCVVYTFANHPLTVLRPDRAPNPLQTVEQRLRDMESCGADAVLLVPFTRELADRPPEAFARSLLIAAHLVVGQNFTFGREGRGTPALLRRLSRGTGCRVHALPLSVVDGLPVSSTRLRQSLARGDAPLAARLLGKSGENGPPGPE